MLRRPRWSIISSDQVAAVAAVENPLAVAVDALPLLVHHLVVFEQVLADFEVAALRPSSGRLRCGGETIRLSIASPSFMPSRVSSVLDPLAGEDPHQVVFERQVEAAAAGIALAAATAAKLHVDAAGFVPLGADDVQAAELGDFLRPRPSSSRAASISRDEVRPTRPAARRAASGTCLAAGPRPSSRGCRRG